MALETRPEFAFELGDGVDLSYSFRSTFKRVYESLPQFGWLFQNDSGASMTFFSKSPG